MKKLIVRSLIIVFATSLNAATASAQSMPSLSSLIEQFGMGKIGTSQLGGAKSPQLPTAASIPKQDATQVQQQPSATANQGSQADASKTLDCINASSNDFGVKIDDLVKQLSATKEGTVPLTAEQNAGLDAFAAKLPIDKDSVVTRGKFAVTAEQEQIIGSFIKSNSDFSSMSKSSCFSKK